MATKTVPNVDRLVSIIEGTTELFRNGPVSLAAGITSKSCRHVSEAPKSDEFEMVKLVFNTVAVDKKKAVSCKNELVKMIGDTDLRYMVGQNYFMTAFKNNMDGDAALRLLALGKVLGLWEFINGSPFNIRGQELKTFNTTIRVGSGESPFPFSPCTLNG